MPRACVGNVWGSSGGGQSNFFEVVVPVVTSEGTAVVLAEPHEYELV